MEETNVIYFNIYCSYNKEEKSNWFEFFIYFICGTKIEIGTGLTLLHCWYRELLLPILTYHFCFTIIGFLHTNICISFLTYQCWIPPYQYWHIIFVLPTLASSIPILAYHFCFTNVGFLHTNIGILFLVYQCWIPPYQYWHIVFDLPMLDSLIPIMAYHFCFTNVGIYNTLPILVSHLLVPKINQIYANENHKISPHWNCYFFPVQVYRLTESNTTSLI